MGLKEFITGVFTATSSISSRRVLAFLFSFVVIFLAFFNYSFEVIKLFVWLIVGLMSLTTFSNMVYSGTEEKQDKPIGFQTKKKEEQ